MLGRTDGYTEIELLSNHLKLVFYPFQDSPELRVVVSVTGYTTSTVTDY